MPGEPGSELDAGPLEDERPAHAAQRVSVVEPDKAMMVEPLFVVGAAEPDLVHQREPTPGKFDRLAATAELFGGNRRDRPGDGPRHVVDDARRIAEIEKAQPLAPGRGRVGLDERHPVFLVPPRPCRLDPPPIDQTVWAGTALVDARQYLLAPAFGRELAQ